MINKNVQNVILVNHARITHPSNIPMPFLSYSENLLQCAYIRFLKQCYFSLKWLTLFSETCVSSLNTCTPISIKPYFSVNATSSHGLETIKAVYSNTYFDPE